MIRKITLLFLIIIGLNQATYAQPICGFDDAHQSMMSTNQAYANTVNQFNSQVAQWVNNKKNMNSLITTTTNGDTVYDIPVVVHIMHTGGAIGSNYNLTDATIEDAIEYLSEVYETTWPSYPGPTSGGTKFPLRFKLAQRTPTCGTTSGINRVNVSTTYSNYATWGINRPSGSQTTGVDDPDLKALSLWPNDRYYNIWVVNKIDGVDGYPGSGGPFVAGYAYFPGAGSNIDGTVILASQMRSGRTTLPHELGHAFNLYHTFQGSVQNTTCPPAENSTTCATLNDRCCDTQPHHLYGAGTCNTGVNNACVSGNFDDATARNIMNYTNCANRFTPDQRDRVLNALINSRSGLISSSATISGAPSLPTVCQPGIINTGGSARNSGPRNILLTDLTSTTPVLGGNRVCLDVSSSGYIGDGNVSYRDLTCQHRATMRIGNTYTIRVTSGAGDRGVLYIDYNNDGNLGNSTDERIPLTSNGAGTIHTAQFTVPATAAGCVPLRMRIISDQTTGYIDSCSDRVYGQTEDYEAIFLGNSSGVNDTVTIKTPITGGNPSCLGSELTLEAVPSTGTIVVGYQWYVNSTLVTGATSDTFVRNNFADQDVVQVKLFFTSICGIDSVLSGGVILDRKPTIPPAVELSITSGTNPTCVDDTITFTAVPTSNPGGSPTFQWRANGVNIAGQTAITFDAFNRVGQQISVVMNSSSSCAAPTSAISDTITITSTTKAPSVSAALTIGTNPGCAGQLLQFTATPQIGGTAPTYQWRVNGINVAGATGATFNSATLNNNDLVSVAMTSNSPCANPTMVVSNNIRVEHQQITADITIAQTSGGNPACQGKDVIFSANTTNAGQNPTYQWLVDGIVIQGATLPIYLTDSLRHTQRVQCVLIATDPCVLNKFDTSNIVTIGITPAKRPSVTVAITAGKNPGCLDSLIEFTASASNIGTAPNYEWLVNGFPAAAGNVFSSSSLLDGNVVVARVNQTDNDCYLPDTVFSTPIQLTRSVTPKAPIISLIGNKIYTNFDSSFIWFGPSGEMPDGPEGVAYPGEIGPYYAVTNNKGCWSKPSNVLGITLLDITSLDVSSLDVYPNPTSDKVILDWNGEAVNYTIDIYNATGQVVGQEVINNETRKEISLGRYAQGNYFLLLKDQTGKAGVIKVTVNNN